MATSIITKAGQTIAGLASTYLKDPSYFRDLCDENGWNPLAETPLPVNVPAIIPELEDVAIAAKSKFDGFRAIADSAATANLSGRLSGYISGISSIAEDIPPEYNGYSQAALNALSDVNGALDGAISTLGEAIDKAERSISKARQYGGETVRLVDWLLS